MAQTNKFPSETTHFQEMRTSCIHLATAFLVALLLRQVTATYEISTFHSYLSEFDSAPIVHDDNSYDDDNVFVNVFSFMYNLFDNIPIIVPELDDNSDMTVSAFLHRIDIIIKANPDTFHRLVSPSGLSIMDLIIQEFKSTHKKMINERNALLDMVQTLVRKGVNVHRQHPTMEMDSIQLTIDYNLPEITEILIRSPTLTKDMHVGEVILKAAASKHLWKLCELLIVRRQFRFSDPNRAVMFLNNKSASSRKVSYAYIAAEELTREYIHKLKMGQLEPGLKRNTFLRPVLALLLAGADHLGPVSMPNLMSYAVKLDDSVLVKYLIVECKVALTTRFKDQVTMPTLAIWYISKNVISYFVEKHAYSFRNAYLSEDRPLHYAIMRNDVDIFRHVLRDLRSDMNDIFTADTDTVLETSFKRYCKYESRLQQSENEPHTLDTEEFNNSTKILQEILLRLPDINLMNIHDRTPLMLAVEHGCPSVVNMLLGRGANPNVMNSEGDTAVTIAHHLGNDDIYELLS